jgi:Fe-Mn family superoxide dismutase
MITLPPLPYAYDSLEPTVSATTMHTHHDKHHAKYVDVGNQLAKENGLEGKSVEELIAAAQEKELKKLFNNAAQAWNHAFFWESMTPDYAAPAGDLAAAIERFGGLAALKERFVEEGANHFASGWAWIGAEGGELKVLSTHDAATLAVGGPVPILVCDVWEHAYYLDYKQDRKGFLEKWFDTVANWAFAAERLAAGDQRWVHPK